MCGPCKCCMCCTHTPSRVVQQAVRVCGHAWEAELGGLVIEPQWCHACAGGGALADNADSVSGMLLT